MDLYKIAHADTNVSDAGKYTEMNKMQKNSLKSIKNVRMCIVHNGQMEEVLNG